MFDSKFLQPLKALMPGQGGRKHTLAYLSFNEQGQIGIRLDCRKATCECGGFYTLDYLAELAKEFKGEMKVNGEKFSKSRAA